VEDAAAEQADGRRAQEHHDGPPRDVLRVGLVLVQFQHLEVVRVDLLFEVVQLLFQDVEPGGVEFFGDFLDQERGKV